MKLDKETRILDVLYPFLLGAAIAFILNVPMRVLEKWIFHNHYTENKKGLRKLARPVSLVLTIVLLIGALGLVMFGVIPELGKTLLSGGSSPGTGLCGTVPGPAADRRKPYLSKGSGNGALHTTGFCVLQSFPVYGVQTAAGEA